MSESITTNAIDLVLGLAPAKTFDIDGFTYIDKDRKVQLFIPPAPATLQVHTLSGFVKLLENGFEGFDPSQTFVQVSAFDTVELVSKGSDKYGRRPVVLETVALKPERSFKFNEYYTQESFNIALRSMFVQDDELNALVSTVGNIAHNTETRQEDDGFSQTVSGRAGTFLRSEMTIKPRVTLKPFRTFLEVDQPAGDFIFRVKNSETAGNTCALFEADGGGWKLTAIDTIAKWLEQQLKTSATECVQNMVIVS